MDGQQIQALLGQWYDIVGQSRGGHGGGGGGGGGGRGDFRRGGFRGDHRGGRRDRDYYNYGYAMPYSYPYPYDGYYPYYQEPQQVAVPVPVPVPQDMTPGVMPPMGPVTASGQWVDLVGANPLAPRAAVVEAPPPTQANRDILPMSTGVPILPTQSAQITGRPQVLAYRCGRFLISNAGTAGGAADWIVNDIKIGNRSQFVQSGDVPGDLFATNAIDTFVRFETAQTAMDVVVVVTYIGLNESGCPFFGAMIGTAAV